MQVDGWMRQDWVAGKFQVVCRTFSVVGRQPTRDTARCFSGYPSSMRHLSMADEVGCDAIPDAAAVRAVGVIHRYVNYRLYPFSTLSGDSATEAIPRPTPTIERTCPCFPTNSRSSLYDI